MALPRLKLPVTEHPVEGAFVPARVFVIACRRQKKFMPGRFLLTCAAAMHCPIFLNPWQASAAPILSPVSATILSPIAGFFDKTSLIFCVDVGGAFVFPWLEALPELWPMELPMPALPIPIPPA